MSGKNRKRATPLLLSLTLVFTGLAAQAHAFKLNVLSSFNTDPIFNGVPIGIAYHPELDELFISFGSRPGELGTGRVVEVNRDGTGGRPILEATTLARRHANGCVSRPTQTGLTVWDTGDLLLAIDGPGDCTNDSAIFLTSTDGEAFEMCLDLVEMCGGGGLPVPGGCFRVSGLAYDSSAGNFWLTARTYQGDMLVKMTLDGVIRDRFLFFPFNRLNGLALDPSTGNLFIGAAQFGGFPRFQFLDLRILEVTPDGRVVDSSPDLRERNIFPDGLSIDPDSGDLFIVSGINRKVYEVSIER